MSQQSIELLVLAMTASGDVSVFRAVGVDGAQATVAGQLVRGFAVEAADDGDLFRVSVLGTGIAESGAAITAGDKLVVDSVGRVTPSTSLSSGAYVVGEALQAASGAGEYIEVLLRPSVGLPAALIKLGVNVAGALVPSVDIALPTGKKLTGAAEVTVEAPADNDLNIGCAAGTGNIVETLSSSDGSTKKSFVDSDAAEIASLNSQGFAQFAQLKGGYGERLTGGAPTQVQMITEFGAGVDGQIGLYVDTTPAGEQVYLCGFSTAAGGWWQLALTAVGA